MRLPVLKWPNPVLKKVSEPVNLLTGSVDVKKLVDDMTETMKAAGGIGLSAIQVGVPLNVVVTVFPGLEVLINPLVMTCERIEAKLEGPDAEVLVTNKRLGKLVDVREGCLSLPGFIEDVKRYDKANVYFETLDQIASRVELGERPFLGEPLTHYRIVGTQPVLAERLAAQCLQHEQEHLRGHFFLDHVKPARRDAIRSALRRAR